MKKPMILVNSVPWIIIDSIGSTPDKPMTARGIDRQHRKQGKFMSGYHYVIEQDGTLVKARSEFQPGAILKGYDRHALFVCLIGGDPFSNIQLKVLGSLLLNFRDLYPEAQVIGRSDVDSKSDSPGFNVKEFALLGID